MTTFDFMFIDTQNGDTAMRVQKKEFENKFFIGRMNVNKLKRNSRRKSCSECTDRITCWLLPRSHADTICTSMKMILSRFPLRVWNTCRVRAVWRPNLIPNHCRLYLIYICFFFVVSFVFHSSSVFVVSRRPCSFIVRTWCWQSYFVLSII